ncbi:toll/interleukin-1 receptor domain-containing protein [Desulfatitalea tepidiphila]|uniref:toll/interleukin-1 receptor domain-containing protein n=1 Tax=Desulfatitalea tepidiphila TaxID=1185843 RepID=UPI0006B5F061|nr:toll/interleukin-1 receptor domain-containing protein [Desulfatitalea tepidiphila]
MNPPVVFISYSHDSAEHKAWVLDFATTLRNRGVDAVLDQWDLRPGDDLPHFMETHLSSCDYVLMICTDNYVEKANAGAGGVGYEKMIMTSSLLSRINSNKVIPIIRQKGSSKLPTFMQSKLYINFSNDDEVEYSFDDLLRTLLKAPLYEKPPIGKAPFAPMQSSRPDRTSDGIRSVMEAVAATSNGSRDGVIYFNSAVRNSSLHRLSFERYFAEAIRLGLVSRDHAVVQLTDKGREYIFQNEIVKL